MAGDSSICLNCVKKTGIVSFCILICGTNIFCLFLQDELVNLCG